MTLRHVAAIGRMSVTKRTMVAAPSRGVLFAEIAALAILALWFVAIAPALISFPLTVALAIAWCIWIERHPEPPSDSACDATRDRDDA